MSDEPRVRHWDKDFNEIPYCLRCGIPHSFINECLRAGAQAVLDSDDEDEWRLRNAQG